MRSTKTNYQKIVDLGIGKGTKGIFKQPNITFYYVKLQPESPQSSTSGVLSVCLIRISNTEPALFARGISFCVPGDQFNKKAGRDAALGRAIQAIEKKQDSNPILKKVGKILVENGVISPSTHYSAYNVKMTEYEISLLTK